MTTQIIPSPAPEQQPAPLFPPTPKTATRVLEFCSAQINNDHTRKAYFWTAPLPLADQRARPILAVKGPR